MLNILVLDDEVAMGRVFERLLLGKAHVMTTTSVEAALVLVENKNFDVIICDIHMPRISGIDFYQRVLDSKSEIAERIIFLTGGLYTETSQRFMESVENSLLLKPFKFEDLMEAITEVVPEAG